MSLTRAIAGSTAIQVAGKFIGTLLGILTVAVMTRHLGRAGYGQFTTATSFLQFFGILVDFGLSLTLIKMIADPKADEPRIASNVFTLRLASASVFFGASALLALLFPYPPVIKAGIAIASLSFLFISLSQVMVGVYQKHLAVGTAALAEVAGRTALLAGVWFAFGLGYGLLAALGILVASNAVQLGLLIAGSRKFLRLRLSFDPGLWKEIIRQSWPIGLSIAFNLVYLKGDVIVLSLVRTQSEVGLYGASYKILDVITVVPTIFMGLVMPVLAASWSGGQRAEFVRRLGRAFDFVSLLALPLMVGTFAVAADLMAFIAGPEFAAAGRFLRILMLAGGMVFWSALFGHTVVAMGLQRRMIWGYAADAVLSLVLYLVFIPRYGAVAASWVTFFSETFMAAATAGVVLTAVRALPPAKTFLRAAAASLAMLAVIWLLGPVHVLVRVAAGIASYGAFLYLFGGISKETLSALRRTAETPV